MLTNGVKVCTEIAHGNKTWKLEIEEYEFICLEFIILHTTTVYKNLLADFRGTYTILEVLGQDLKLLSTEIGVQ